jgi:tRNA dimethylallyltransferase
MSDRNGVSGGDRCLCLIGPTAVGKTEFALRLASEFPVEIVSLDSAMVYRGMNIGTAKPDAAQRQAVPHHLIDILEPEQTYSAGQFADDARQRIAEIDRRGNVALIVGGTLLYLRALREGLAELPPRDEAIRAAIDEEADRIGWPAMHARLAVLDPVAARRIQPSDRQRIQRALEVHSLSGRPITELQRQTAGTELSIASFALLPPDREQLKVDIERRFDEMVEQGFVDEVKALMQRPTLGPDHASMRAVGYRQLWRHLEGAYDWAEARSRAVAATRQLAKRQLTWLRGDTQSERLDAGGKATLERLRSAVANLVAARAQTNCAC